MFIAALFTVAKTWKQVKHSLMDEQTKRMIHTCATAHARTNTHTHTHTLSTMWYYSAMRKKAILPFLTT